MAFGALTMLVGHQREEIEWWDAELSSAASDGWFAPGLAGATITYASLNSRVVLN